MKTKLYRMWVDYCKAPERRHAMYGNAWHDKDTGEPCSNYDVAIGKTQHPIQYGVIRFNDKHYGTCVSNESPEYHAWNAFMAAISIENVIKFVAMKFKHLEDSLPATCMFLDLHSLKPRDMLKKCNKAYLDGFKHALSIDIMYRKKKT